MHELSIAQMVLGLTLETASGRRVRTVQLRVGHLRQVVPTALSFAWELVTRGTPAEGAELAVEDVPAAAVCAGCGAKNLLSAPPFVCGECGDGSLDIVRGEELMVDWIELEEPEEGEGHGHRREEADSAPGSA